MEGLENNNTEKKLQFTMPTFANMNWELWVAILGLLIALLPSIMLKFLAFDSEAMLTPDSIIAQPSFNAITVLVGLVFSLYSLARAKEHYATKTIALIALVVVVLRLLLQ